MRKTALFAIAVLFSSWPCLAQSRPDGTVEMQRQAGAHAREAAAQYGIVAEEIEINFGRAKAANAAAARETLSGVVERDVPAALSEIARAESGRPVGRPASPTQDVILQKLRALTEPADSSLAVERLREKAAELADAQADLRRTTGRLAQVDVTGKPDRVRARFRESVAMLAGSQADIAAATRALGRSTRSALETAPDGEEKEKIQRALSAADLAAASEEAAAAAEKLAQDDRTRALADQSSALARLEAMRDALSPRPDSAGTQGRLGELASDERRLSKQSAGEAAERAAKQEQILGDLENIQAKMPDSSLEALLANAATEEMGKASKAFADAAASPEGRDERLAEAAEKARKAADFLDAAAKAAGDPKTAQLGRELKAAAEQAAREEKALTAMNRLSQEQEAIAKATESEKPRSEGLRNLSDAQDAVRKEAFGLSQGQKAGDSKPSAQDAHSSGEVKGNLAKAAASMKSAATALSQAKKHAASNEQRNASQSLERAVKAQAQSADAAAERLSRAAEAMQARAPSPMPETLASALAGMSRAAQSAQQNAHAASGSGGKGRGGSSAAGLAGLAPGSPGALGPEARGRAWDARLGRRAKTDTMQSAAAVFPKGYEESLKKYYEAIARQ